MDRSGGGTGKGGGELGELGEVELEQVERREREMQERERWEKIGGSRYNRWYGMVKGKGVPGYLEEGWGESE